MGYRSDIYIKVDKASAGELMQLIDKHELSDSITKESEDEVYTSFYGSHLKWYSSYPDVAAINAFINDEKFEGERGLMAIGEDNQTWTEGSADEVGLYVQVLVEGWG